MTGYKPQTGRTASTNDDVKINHVKRWIEAKTLAVCACSSKTIFDLLPGNGVLV